jgi:hypothetical protein
MILRARLFEATTAVAIGFIASSNFVKNEHIGRVLVSAQGMLLSALQSLQNSVLTVLTRY